MRFIAVERLCAEKIIQDHFLQSVDFNQGECLAKNLKDFENTFVHQKIVIIENNDGLYYISKAEPTPDLIIIDLETTGLFKNLDDRSALRVFQSILRFSIRYLSSMKLSKSEMIIKDSTKAVIFPYEFTYNHPICVFRSI